MKEVIASTEREAFFKRANEIAHERIRECREKGYHIHAIGGVCFNCYRHLEYDSRTELEMIAKDYDSAIRIFTIKLEEGVLE